MPFVTAVSMGASAATEFLSNTMLRQDAKKRQSVTGILTTKIRPMGENELLAQDAAFGNSGNVVMREKYYENGGSHGAGSVRRKSVSFVDLSTIGMKLSLAPTMSESGYSSTGSSSSASSNNSDDLSPAWFENSIANGGSGVTSVGQGHGTHGRRTLLKSWIWNKLHLTRNGKYSFAGSLTSLSHFGLRLNKSLLVECTPETEYSTEKFYSLESIPNALGSDGNEDTVDSSDATCNLFVSECLKTYSSSHLELVERKEPWPSFTRRHAGNGNYSTTSDNNSTTPNRPQIIINNEETGKSNNLNGEDTGHFETRNNKKAVAPDWFWDNSSVCKEAQLDEAGIALQGTVHVMRKDQDLGSRFIQVKWESTEEIFWLIVWTETAGQGILVKVDLSEVEPIWTEEGKVSFPSENLVFHSEQNRGLLKDLYTICSHLGSCDKSAELASSNNVERVEEVVQLFQRVTLDISAKHALDAKQPRKVRASNPVYFLLQLESLEFRLKTELGYPVESYYIFISLFDARSARKISEDFHSTVDIQGKFVTRPKVLFRVTEVHEQIYLVIRVEKTLQGSESDAYLRGNPDGKAGSKVSKNVTTSPLYTEGQRYRMPLCWTTKSMFSKRDLGGGESSTSFNLDLESPFTPFYKHEKGTDEDLLKMLADIRRPEKVSKLTVIPGIIRVALEKASTPVAQEIMAQRSDDGTPVIIAKEFPCQSIEPFRQFSHLLYVYPVTLNLMTVTSKIRARNILCRVFLRSEDDIDASPLELNPCDGLIGTHILYHRGNPEWYSEVKLSLPVALDPRLHLLFQFYHISCSFEKGNKQVENIIGYAWIPLLNKFRFIGGEHLLPIASNLPSGYLQIQPLGLGRGSHSLSLSDEEIAIERRGSGGTSPQLLHILSRKRFFKPKSDKYSGPEISWLEKSTLSVKLNLLSTVWTKCGSLGAFFAHAEKLLQKGISSNGSRFLHCDDENTTKSIKTLESIDLDTLRDFFPTIINQICNVAKISKSIGLASFKFLIFAFHAVIEAGLEHIIQEYTGLRFLAAHDKGNEFKQTSSLAEVLVDAWIELFETGDGATIANSLELSKHFFTMILKSVAIQGFHCSNPEESKLVKLVQLFTCEVVQRCQPDHGLARTANESVVQFVCSALSVITQRHVVFATINSYLACFGPGDSHKVQDFKFYMLQHLVKHPSFLELNSAVGDDEFTRLDNANWSRRHFLVATVMKQSRSGLGEVSNVRSLALKPIIDGLIIHEERRCQTGMWIPWLRVVCDNLHRISTSSLHTTHSSRCSSVSTILSATAGTLVQAALTKSLNQRNTSLSLSNGSGSGCEDLGNGGELDTPRKSSLRVRNGGLTPSLSTNSSMSNISSITAGNGDRMSLDRLSLTSCDYLDAISAIKMSNPAASTAAPSEISVGSGSGTIVNEKLSTDSASGDGVSLGKDPSDVTTDDEMVKVGPSPGSLTEQEKSNVVLRRYDKLNDVETSQLLLSGLYILKTMGKDGLRTFWLKSSSQERASLLQMIHLACSHFTSAKKAGTTTRKKVVGIVVPPTMPPSPRASLLPSKKWSSLPLKGTADEAIKVDDLALRRRKSTTTNDWKALSSEATFVCVDTLANLCTTCKGENNEMRDIIRTTLDVAKTSEDTRAMLSVLENLYRIDDLASIVFTKGNEDLSHQLFCEVLNGFGTTYLINSCVGILAKLYLNTPTRTISQSLLAISSLSLTPAFVHNFRKSLGLLEKGMSINERSSFVIAITEKLSFIDLHEFEPKSILKSKNSFRHLKSGTGRRGEKISPNNLPVRLGTILNSLWLLKSCTNDYRLSELYLKLANSYSFYAGGKLRIDAFESLKDEHLSRKRFSEALLCELHIAAGLARLSATPEVKKIMLGISQNLKDEFEQSVEGQEEEDTTEELIQRLETCVHLCEKAERYELMLEVYRILVDIQEFLSDYAALEHSYKQMSRACALIQNKRERFLATYYRVALYQPRKTSLKRPVEVYVYKEPNVTSLMEVCNKVENAENATIISGDTEQLRDDDRIYATITHLTPIPSESPRRKLWSEDFRRHQNVNKFCYDTPFTVKVQDRISVDNKAAVHQQWKRRTTIQTEYTFPSVVSRLRVISSEEEDLSPIRSAIDDMQRRVMELRSERNSVDLKRIQLRLQGSVSVQVNQGPLAYARAFLDREHEFPIQDINKLKAIFRDFVECCGELLIRNGQLISPEQIDYQKQLESDYTKLCQVLSSVLGLPESALNRMSRISVSSC